MTRISKMLSEWAPIPSFCAGFHGSVRMFATFESAPTCSNPQGHADACRMCSVECLTPSQREIPRVCKRTTLMVGYYPLLSLANFDPYHGMASYYPSSLPSLAQYSFRLSHLAPRKRDRAIRDWGVRKVETKTPLVHDGLWWWMISLISV